MEKQIPFKIIELEKSSFHFVVKGKVNGTKVLFIIDTGASRTLIDKQFAKELKKIELNNESPIATGLMAEQIPVELLSIQSLKLGKFKFKNITTLTADLTAINNVYHKLTGKQIGGLIGSDFLTEYVKSINIAKKKLIIKNR